MNNKDLNIESINSTVISSLTCTSDGAFLNIKIPVQLFPVNFATPRRSQDGFRTIDIDSVDLIDHTNAPSIHAVSDNTASGKIKGPTILSLGITLNSKKPEDHPDALKALSKTI